MADKFIRIGSSEDLFGYDDGDYSESIEVAEPIKCTGTPIDADHLAKISDISAATADYLLLAGRSGGQEAYGGTDAGDDLTLHSTSHATKGSIILVDDVDISAHNIITDTTTGLKIATATNQKLGFFNSTPIVQPSALTAQETTLTFTEPGTPDYAFQDVTNTTPWGFAVGDELRTFIGVVENLQVRVAELESKLKSLGLVA